ncbi:endochitinase A-like [Penaeus chinensis]|uniref:endochitinase A-like n=1 Tax=Penaeus chinensis TaxID=139456 RepID=UPI001FB7C86B|nr:endochitinase A-like [Penaeus chinensis]
MFYIGYTIQYLIRFTFRSLSSWAWLPSLRLTAGNPMSICLQGFPLKNLLSPTSPPKPNTTSTGPSAMTPQATSSDTRRLVTTTTLRDPTTCSSPTAACRLSSTSWTATLATWPKSATRARPVIPTPMSHLSLSPLSQLSLANTDLPGLSTSTTPTSPSKLLTLQCSLFIFYIYQSKLINLQNSTLF